ncbi:MAG TPA: DUF899 domain-containing protein [Trebonia sp.]|jgi:predicted dithiol-disulfide oxidoreductase (DUF899 family)|nr:DUF899 domain-containing protein [Trebonia sp.]
MALPQIVSREEWLAARKQFLAAEKAATRSRDALNAERRRLPMVRVDKDYRLDGPDGPVPLAALFDGKSQLIVQHVMFGPDWDAACPGCTAGIDEVSDGMLAHLRSRDTAFALVSRAPLGKLRAYAASRGWTVPWYSSAGSDFNYDFGATLDSGRQLLEYNYRPAPEAIGDGETSAEVPGVSCFLAQDGQVFHTYSTWARGTDILGSSYSWLDLTALGRQEDWEEPTDRAPGRHGADPTFTD